MTSLPMRSDRNGGGLGFVVPVWLLHNGLMRQAFAHEAVLDMVEGADVRAPGAAITVALCGHWDHQPPCPLAPHHNREERVGGQVRVRTLFAVEPEREGEARQRIERALAGGLLEGPGAVTTRWSLRVSRPAEVAPDEAEHAARLVREP